MKQHKTQRNKIIIAGPCVVESLELCLEVAIEVKRACEANGFKPIFKASYDKANRTSLGSFRGVGISKALDILSEVRLKVGVPIITDVHETSQVEVVQNIVDFLQVPAFLCRQTDLIEACAASGKPTLIKKGQFLSHETCEFIERKFYKSNGMDMMIAERGNSFGYNDLVVDVTSISRLKAACKNSLVIMDCTHSLQKPNGVNGRTGGQSKHIIDMVKFGAIMDADGLFIETHPRPKDSPSDAENMLELSKLDSVLSLASKIYKL
jgi:2-dehydro-3-deoxyphosphooctonate aldolase (KDO 8-P synthase)